MSALPLRPLRFVLLAAVALATGCGNGQAFLSGGVCGDGASATAAVASKVQRCAALNTSFAGGFSPCFDVGACESNLQGCSASDQAALEAVAACQNAYARNTDCSFAGWSVFQTCAANAATLPDAGAALSAACTARFNTNPGLCAIPDAGS